MVFEFWLVAEFTPLHLFTNLLPQLLALNVRCGLLLRFSLVVAAAFLSDFWGEERDVLLQFWVMLKMNRVSDNIGGKVTAYAREYN